MVVYNLDVYVYCCCVKSVNICTYVYYIRKRKRARYNNYRADRPINIVHEGRVGTQA